MRQESRHFVQKCNFPWHQIHKYLPYNRKNYMPTHSVWKSQKKSHSALRAKRATFTFWVDKSWLKMPKWSILGIIWKPENATFWWFSNTVLSLDHKRISFVAFFSGLFMIFLFYSNKKKYIKDQMSFLDNLDFFAVKVVCRSSVLHLPCGHYWKWQFRKHSNP